MKEELKPPFRFNFLGLLSTARRKVNNQISGITIRLPGVSFNVLPDDIERQIAHEIIIRLADKRVLNSKECCDDCITNALESIQNIRSILVDKQVQLSKVTDGSLYLLIELMLGGIRQFLTFIERQDSNDRLQESALIVPSHLQRPSENREIYFPALELLRSHLYRCLEQISVISGSEIPKIREHMRYSNDWQLEAYETPQL